MIGRSTERVSPDRNPDWYRIRYQLAALYLNEATAGWVPPDAPKEAAVDDRRRLALTETKDLAAETAKNIEDFASIDRYLVEFLQTTVEPSLLVLLAGALLFDSAAQDRPSERGKPPSTHAELMTLLAGERINPWALIEYVQPHYDLAPRVLYNLACFYARAAALVDTEPWMKQAVRQIPSVSPLPEATKWLVRAVRQTPITERQALFNMINRDPALTDLRERADLLNTIETLERETRRATDKPNRQS
jgi:hypothetical protein